MITVRTNGQRTEYLIDANNFTGYQQTILETTYDAQQTITKQVSYVFGLDEITQIVTDSSGTQTYVFQHDAHGSVRLLTSLLGALVQQYTYDAYDGWLGRSWGVYVNQQSWPQQYGNWGHEASGDFFSHSSRDAIGLTPPNALPNWINWGHGSRGERNFKKRPRHPAVEIPVVAGPFLPEAKRHRSRTLRLGHPAFTVLYSGG